MALAWLLRRPVCLADPRFTTPDLRREHGAALRAELVAVFATHMPCGMVRSVFETAFLVQIGDRGVRLPLNIAGRPIGTSSGGQRGFLFSRDVSTVSAPPFHRGADGAAILAQFGFTTAERDGVLVAAPAGRCSQALGDRSWTL